MAPWLAVQLDCTLASCDARSASFVSTPLAWDTAVALSWAMA